MKLGQEGVDYHPRGEAGMKKRSALALAMTGGLEVAMTPWAGVGVLVEAMRQTEVRSKADKVLPLKRSRKGLSSGEMLECFVLLSTLGGDCVEDMERLRQDDALGQMLGHSIPAAETARQWLDKFHEEELLEGRPQQGCFLPPESGPLVGLGEVNNHVVRAYMQNVKVGKRVTLDVDAHLVETGKANALYCYDGYKSFQPLVVCWAETGLVLRDEFRDGNVPASMDNRRLVDEAYEALPEGEWEVWVRSDSAAYEQDNLDHWDGCGWRFAVSADMSVQLKAVIEGVDEGSWEVMDEKGGVRREWAEVDYVPSRKNERRDSKPFRYVAVRLSRLQGELFGDWNRVRHFAVVSNIWDMGGKELLEWHRGKAGTIEHVHHVIKGELGGRVYPSGKHGANAAWLRLQVITHNLLELLKGAVLPEEYAKAEPKRLRFGVFTCLGQVVRHAHRVVLKVMEKLWVALLKAAGARALALSPPVC
ncbi:IS1380 family transposase [Chloroflexota bacterium]